jgi:hypothetical protein
VASLNEPALILIKPARHTQPDSTRLSLQSREKIPCMLAEYQYAPKCLSLNITQLFTAALQQSQEEIAGGHA